MAQRVLIAGGVSCEPEIMVADEPTTALDVTVQAEVLDLLRGLQEERGMALLFVTHNFGVVADFCDHAIVMQKGAIVESGTTSQIFADPQPTSRNTRMFLCSLLHGRRPGPRLVPAMAFETTGGGSMNAQTLLEVESLVTQFLAVDRHSTSGPRHASSACSSRS